MLLIYNEDENEWEWNFILMRMKFTQISMINAEMVQTYNERNHIEDKITNEWE
jgi:hypothetical protein